MEAKTKSPTINWRTIINRFKINKYLKQYIVLFALFLLIIISAILSPVFLRPRNIFNILRQNSFVGIIAVGMTFAIISGGFDLSVGSMLAFVGGSTILIMNNIIMLGINNPGSDFPFELAAVLVASFFAILMGLALGKFNGTIISKGKISPFVATLAGWPFSVL